MQNHVYNRTFSANILIVEKTACGKAYFTQKIAFFVKLVGLKMFENKFLYTAYAYDATSKKSEIVLMKNLITS